MRADEKPTDRSIRRHAIAGLAVVFGLLGGSVAWSAMAKVSGAVVAPGHVAVDGSAKKVQHPEGGVVAELRVREGARVEAGDVLIVLDDTVLGAELAIVTKALDEFTAVEARLLAERDGAAGIRFPRQLTDRAASNPDAKDSVSGQEIVFESRRRSRHTARTQLSEQVSQLESLIGGLDAQRAAREQELSLIGEELQGVRDLFDRQLAPLTRVIALDRDRTRIEGERGKLTADIATTRGHIAEKKIEMVRLDDDFHAEVVRELAELRNRINEMVERMVAAKDRMSRIEIRAPVSGRVHELSVFTVGGVIGAGEVTMLIVPEDDRLVVEAEIEPQNIDELRVGQAAVVRFSAFSDPNLKDAAGEIITISPDLVADHETGRAFYRVRLAVAPPAGPEGQELKLVPGMPVETFVATEDRTVLAYLIKPVKDQMRRVFRE